MATTTRPLLVPAASHCPLTPRPPSCQSQTAVVRFKTKDIGSPEKLLDIIRVLPQAQQKWAAHRFETINDHAKPCPLGHTSRYYSSNACTVCYLQRQAARYRKRNQQK